MFSERFVRGGRRLFIPSRLRDDIPRRKDTKESVDKNGIFRGQVLKNVVLIRILVGIFQILSIINSKAFPSKSNIFLLGGGGRSLRGNAYDFDWLKL